MSSMLKTSLALSKFKSLDQRHQWKRAMIDAELCSKIVAKPTKDRNSNNGPRGTSNYAVTSNSATPTA